eukprot:gnl/TRDRNA2_/TRDRNA2_146632_c0_seq1.p1 gnl/TRDRNA2_/TRDRNA2_146632_c0~~gnl/TRDRNA2_/TRDRNA2_146632_c0_seq1.p1  ORF type:complete len:336 (+),score=37.21 gnl/TRDRNA2_/TRDRNA2_146632_c0_seq1:73-1008(+)
MAQHAQAVDWCQHVKPAMGGIGQTDPTDRVAWSTLASVDRCISAVSATSKPEVQADDPLLFDIISHVIDERHALLEEETRDKAAMVPESPPRSWRSSGDGFSPESTGTAVLRNSAVGESSSNTPNTPSARLLPMHLRWTASSAQKVRTLPVMSTVPPLGRGNGAQSEGRLPAPMSNLPLAPYSSSLRRTSGEESRSSAQRSCSPPERTQVKPMRRPSPVASPKVSPEASPPVSRGRTPSPSVRTYTGARQGNHQPTLAPGAAVRLRGLLNDPEFNNREGFLECEDVAMQCWIVCLHDGERKGVKAENLVFV